MTGRNQRVPALWRWTAIVSAVALSACVSQVSPVLESAATSQFAPSDVPMQVASVPAMPAASAAAPSDPAPAATAEPVSVAAAAPAPPAAPAAALPGAGAYEVVRAPGAIPVPIPAPRDQASANGVTTLAFAPTATDARTVAASTGLANAVPLPEAAAVAEPAPAAVAPAPEVRKPKTLFEALFANAQKRDTAKAEPQARPRVDANSVRTASLTPSAAPANGLPGVRPNDSLTGLEPLPGVKKGDHLFGIGSEDGEEDIDEKPVQFASIGAMTRLSPNGLRTQTDKVDVSCFPPDLVFLLKKIEGHYGRPVVVTSGYRSATENRRAGGAKKSTHIQCMAADIQVANVSKWDLAKYLRTLENRGGVGTYCRTESVHIDVGPERDWHYPCRRTKKKRRA